MLKFFKNPFAVSGTKVTVPPTDPGTGAVSYPTGYGSDYELVSTDPASRNIERTGMNGLFFDLTNEVRLLQSQGVPDFITAALNEGAAFSYDVGAICRYSGEVYMSRTAANTSLPTVAANWMRVDFSGRLINVRRFSTPGAVVYTPTPGTNSVIVECQGAGGAGGGGFATGPTELSMASGGSAGAYGKGRYLTGFSGVTVTIGSGGTGMLASAQPVVSGVSTAEAGDPSSFGGILVSPGGPGGTSTTLSNSTARTVTGSNGSALSTGGNIINSQGAPGLFAIDGIGGGGGSSSFGGAPSINVIGLDGQPASSLGAGGSGAYQNESGGALVGGSGANGVVVVYEYS